jgi:hypothetical protein
MVGSAQIGLEAVQGVEEALLLIDGLERIPYQMNIELLQDILDLRTAGPQDCELHCASDHVMAPHQWNEV